MFDGRRRYRAGMREVRPDLSSILDSADDLRVGAIAQRPYCADPKRDGLRETFDYATEQGYDYLPMRDEDDGIRRIVATSTLARARSWDAVRRKASTLSADQLVARDAPVFSLLERLTSQEVLFTLGRDGVDGVVTIFDLNQPAAHLLGFGLALICEAEVARVLRAELGDDRHRAEAIVADIIGKKAPGVRRYRKAVKADANVHLATSLMFGEKLKVLPTHGLATLAQRRGISPAAMERELEEIKDLRNAIGHADNTKDRLADPHWVHARMTVANAMARWIAASSPVG